MKKRTLGKHGPQVSSIGLGCMGLNYGYAGTLSRKDAVALIRHAFDKWVTFLINR